MRFVSEAEKHCGLGDYRRPQPRALSSLVTRVLGVSRAHQGSPAQASYQIGLVNYYASSEKNMLKTSHKREKKITPASLHKVVFRIVRTIANHHQAVQA